MNKNFIPYSFTFIQKKKTKQYFPRFVLNGAFLYAFSKKLNVRMLIHNACICIVRGLKINRGITIAKRMLRDYYFTCMCAKM